eukprot:scaffold137_cov398-Prasinococcus_capsulatus_cf.AAC.60
MALLEANNQRTADVQCDTDCDLLCLTSDDFTRVMAESEGKQTLERIYTIANERRKASQLISKGYKDMLKACNLFQNLPDDAIEQLFKEMDAVFKPSGAYIAREGEPGTCMWLVYNGQVDILKNEEGMESTIVSELGVGQYFGEIALLEEGGIRTADVRARGSVMLLKLEKESFERVGKRLCHMELIGRACVRRHFREVDDMVIREASLRLQGLHAVTSRSVSLAPLISRSFLVERCRSQHHVRRESRHCQPRRWGQMRQPSRSRPAGRPPRGLRTGHPTCARMTRGRDGGEVHVLGGHEGCSAVCTTDSL